MGLMRRQRHWYTCFRRHCCMKCESRYSFLEDCFSRPHFCMCKLWGKIYVEMFNSIIFKQTLERLSPHNFIHQPNGSNPLHYFTYNLVFIEQNMHTCLMIFVRVLCEYRIYLLHFIVYYYAILDYTIYEFSHDNDNETFLLS